MRDPTQDALIFHVFDFKTIMNRRNTYTSLMFSACNFHVPKNLLSYCGLVDAKITASDKDLPVICSCNCFFPDEN